MNDHESVQSLVALLGYLDATLNVRLLQAHVSEEDSSFYDQLGEMRARCMELLSSVEVHGACDVAGHHVPLAWISRAAEDLQVVYSELRSSAA